MHQFSVPDLHNKLCEVLLDTVPNLKELQFKYYTCYGSYRINPLLEQLQANVQKIRNESMRDFDVTVKVTDRQLLVNHFCKSLRNNIKYEYRGQAAVLENKNRKISNSYKISEQDRILLNPLKQRVLDKHELEKRHIEGVKSHAELKQLLQPEDALGNQWHTTRM